MAKGFDILNVKSAVKARNKFDLSRTHLTTMDFGEIVPLMVEEVVPGDKFSVSSEFFSRMAPLAKPTYGKFSFKTVAGYVPYHQIADDADAWLAGKATWEGQTTHHRYILIGGLVDFILANCLETSTVDATQPCDFSFVDASGSVKRFKFTSLGRYYIKILNALGYAVPQGADLRSTSTWYNSIRTVRLSAYPLIAFAKLYNDYMSQSQRFNTSQLSDLLFRIKHNITYTNGYSPSGELTGNGIAIMLQNIKLNYENDYFTSAWQNANIPLASVSDSMTTAPIPRSVSSQVVVGQHDNTFATSVQNGVVNIGQRALDFLKDFDDWVRRNNYSGSRAVQQVYSRFGIKTDDYRSNYAHVVKTDTMPVQVGDITSTADAGDAVLGEYAGKGIMNGNTGFSVEADDYGIIIVLGYFTVVPMNSFGYDKRVLRNSPLDYYNPEFDGLGAEPISLGEVWEDATTTPDEDTTLTTGLFGYTERYNSYRYGRDMITGEFRDYHNDGKLNVWHTGRNLEGLRKNNELVAQSTSMNTLPQVNSEYNRIFSVTDDSVNHFYVTAHFKVDAIRPMLNLNQVPRLGEGDTRVPRNGNVIS